MKKSTKKTSSGSTENTQKNSEFQKNNLSAIFNSINASIWTIDKNYCLIYGNSAFQEDCMKGLGHYIETGENLLSEKISSNEKKDWKTFYDRTLKGEKFSTERKKKYSPDTWSAYHFSPVLNDAGEYIGASVVAHDITEQVLTKRNLQKSNNRFEELVEMLPEAVFEMDLNFRLTYANKHAMNMFGYSPDDISNGLHALDMLVPEERERAKLNFSQRTKGDHPGIIEYKALKKDGTVFPIQFHAASIYIDDKLAGARGVIIDITERKQKEAELERMALMLDVAPNSIIIYDFNGKILYANQKTFDYHGYSRNEFMSLSLQQIDSTKSSKLIEKRMKNIREHGEVHFEVEHIKKDRSLLSLEIHALVTKWGEQNVILSIGTDISERKKVELALRQNESFLREGQKIAKLGTYKMDISSGFWESSKVLDEIFGIDDNYEKNVEGWLKIIHPDWREIMDDYLINEVFGNKNEFNKEYKIIRRNDNKERWLHGRGRLEFDEKGNPVEMIGTIQDITSNKEIQGELIEAKEKAEENQNKLHTLISTIPDLIWLKDTEGVYLQCNKRFENLFGSKEEEIIGKTDYDFVDKKTADFFRKNDKAAMLAGGPTINEEEVTFASDGHKEYLETIKTPLFDNDKKIIGVLGIGRNITQRLITERELVKAKEKAEESDRLKSAFLANMSHEIRTPMNGILGFADLLKEPQLSGEEQKKYIAIIEESGNRMLNTINDIIDISKIESGQMDVNISSYKISEQIENILSFFKPETDKKGIALSYESKLAKEENLIYSDKNKLNSIIINLVKNAIKYCDKGKIEIGCSRKKNELEFFIKDTGRGIPEDRQKAIFDRFVQADIDDREVREGAGLGLTITKSYLDMLGGRIWLKSSEGSGTTFYFTIPYSPIKVEKNNKTSKKRIKAESGKTIKLNILIVEDDQISETLTKMMLEKFSKQIYTAKTGSQAVELCRRNPDINLILMDIRLPEMNGYDATQEIRKFNTDVLIIAQTAFALEGDREKAIASGCNDYISKPVNRNILSNLIEKYF